MESATNLLVNQAIDDGSVQRFAKIQRCNYLEDRISYLPDEILILVLSCLDIKQQARTSVLARRWSNLWRYAMSLSFVFQDDDDFEFLEDEQPLYDARCSEFAARVNLILELLLVTSIEDFTVVFSYNSKSYQRDIDGWLKFALQKRVKRLKLKLSWACSIQNRYYLTNEVISNHKVDSLTSVHLQHLDVAGDFLEWLLTVSPFLEELFVLGSETLVSFTVTGRSLKLKYLEISCCSKLEHLNIYDVNLEAFKYYGGYSKCIAIKDTPCLVKAHFTWVLVDNNTENAVKILSQLHLLETLIVEPSIVFDFMGFPKFPKMRYLKNLELLLSPNNICCLLCAHLLEACPVLSELKIEFQFFKEDTSEEEKMQKLEHQHMGLKVVKLIGFIGCRVDLAMALYLIENVATLEKMMVDTNHMYTTSAVDPNKQDTARTLAREQLSEKLPPGAQLIVI